MENIFVIKKKKENISEGNIKNNKIQKSSIVKSSVPIVIEPNNVQKSIIKSSIPKIVKPNQAIIKPSIVIKPTVILKPSYVLPNNDLKKDIIFKLNYNAGFYSQLFFLLQAYIHSKKTHSSFYIDSSVWCYTFNKGWNDYFKTNFNYIKNSNNSIIYSHCNVPKISNYSLNDYINAINDIYILNQDLIEKGNKIITELHNNYISIFIRRGDKFIETEFIDISLIISKINITNETILFIQTDDYSVVEQIKILLPNNIIYSTVPKDKKGSYHISSYLHESSNKHLNIIPLCNKRKDQIKEDTDELLIGVYVCKMAKECWIDHTSNVSRFIKLSSPNTVKFYSTDLILNYEKITICPAYEF